MRDDAEKIIRRIHDLPTLPLLYTRVSELLRNPYTSASDIAAVISDDQVIAARLLKLVNSAHFAFPERIDTITRAVSLVGVKAVKNLVLATSVMDLFSGTKSQQWSSLEFWRHSLAVATMANILGAKFLPTHDPEEFFVAGLIHDIGKVVWLEYFPEELDAVVEMAHRQKIPMIEAERELFGFTHTRAGRMLTRRWGLPERLVEAVARHHEPQLAQIEPAFTAVIHLANVLAGGMALGKSGNGSVQLPHPFALQLCPLGVEDMPALLDEALAAYEDAIGLMDSLGAAQAEPALA